MKQSSSRKTHKKFEEDSIQRFADVTEDSFTELFKLGSTSKIEGQEKSESARRGDQEYTSKPKFKDVLEEERKSTKSNMTENVDSFTLWSDEDTSPISKKSRSNDENIKISPQPLSAGLDTEPLEPEFDQKRGDITDLLKDDSLQYCPICYKKNNFTLHSAFLSHLKSCASKNKLSTQQLMKAIELQQKQTSERTALGLPSVSNERQNPRRPATRKETKDPNLQLAIALSASLRESEMMDKIRETEGLLEAGLEKEALSQCKQLEDYGFLTSKPAESIPSKSVRSKNTRDTILFSRSQEQRERIITEKIAIILVDSNTQSDVVSITDTEARVLKSNFLRNHLDVNATSWNKSHQLEEHTEYDCYYIENLSSYVSPYKLSVGSKLKHVSQIPCRPLSPGKINAADSVLSELAKIFSHENSKCTIESVAPKREPLNFDKPKLAVAAKRVESDYSQLARDWKCLVNRNTLSDITIYAKYEKLIFAHKLVLHVRCRSILADVIKEHEGDKCTEIIMWLDYSPEAVIAFLEYIYTAELSHIINLTENQQADLRKLSTRYSIREIADLIDLNCFKGEMFAKDDNKIEDEPSKIFENGTPTSSANNTKPANDDALMTEGEQNLLLLQFDLQTQTKPLKGCGGSPEMFDSADEFDGDERGTRHVQLSESDKSVLDLCSPECSPRTPSLVPGEISGSRQPMPSTPNNCTFQLPSEVEKITPDVYLQHKRISCSPLHKLDVKKPKIGDESIADILSPGEPSRESSDSDMYLIDTESRIRISKKRRSTKRKKCGQDDFDSSIELDEYRKLCTETDNDVDFRLEEIENRDLKSDFDRNNLENDADPKRETSPYVSPVWDGFEDINYDFCGNDNANDYCESPKPLSPLPNLAKSTPVRLSNEPYFDSFSVDESLLNRLEKETKTQPIVTTPRVNIATPECIRKFRSRSKSDNVLTPMSKDISDVTPMANYSRMKSTELKKELDRYGLKPSLSRGKAKKLLRYIYDQMHPFQDDGDDNAAIRREPNNDLRKCIPNNHPIYEMGPMISERHHDCDDSEDSSSLSSGVNALEESSTEDDPSTFSQDINGAARIKSVTLDNGFKALIGRDKPLHRKILLYEPIWFEPMRERLKQDGVKCSAQELMNYLDEKCITFRSQNQRGQHKIKKKATVIMQSQQLKGLT